ncbi:molybdate ABC transporter substrate-binding protein [uncultured Olsenella sp.]|uniref:molybdate ABC transporter substrate-binding protein n=1 Tax=uncultured Olsenella sp. TaxID=190764 RepID=UPI0026DB66B9|nr:molybdate ABC transporter substrate-binding protein [uncultured Olsenella sp.]
MFRHALTHPAITRRGLLRLGAAASLLSVWALPGCSGNGADDGGTNGGKDVASSAPLSGKSLNVYCGAGMAEPFKEIAQRFQDETGCTMNVTYANAAQIATQIRESGTGDLWIAGSVEETERLGDALAASTDLVRHIPVLAVPSSNPRNIQSIVDLANADAILIGDPESTPIGKVARAAMTKAGIWDEVQGRVSTTTTAPQISAALANGQGDAGIVWKENVGEGVSIVAESDMEPFAKTVPAAELSGASDSEALSEFVGFLTSDEARKIWESHGYETV